MDELRRKIIMAGRKPKKKFSSQEQKHHYVQAAKHFHGYRQSWDDDEKSQKHIDAFHQHAKAGKLTDFHRDQLQHDARHFGMPKGTSFTPYQKQKRGKKMSKSLLLIKAKMPKIKVKKPKAQKPKKNKDGAVEFHKREQQRDMLKLRSIFKRKQK